MATLLSDERCVVQLRDAIAFTLSREVKAHTLEKVCGELRLPLASALEPFSNKAKYVKDRLPEALDELLAIAGRVLERFPSYELQEALWSAQERAGRRISEITRRGVLDSVLLAERWWGEIDPEQFLKRVWPLDSMMSTDARFSSAAGDFYQHFVSNDDWSSAEVFDRLNLLGCSEKRFIMFLEALAHPVVRKPDDQSNFTAALNKWLSPDGLELRAAEYMSGRPIYRVVSTGRGVRGAVKNIIFASSGPKPELVLADAVNNDIVITKNAEHCLVFDKAVPSEGLSWNDMVAWWAELQGGSVDDAETVRALYMRLESSLASPPEKVLFRAYYGAYKGFKNIPALIPQVYLHYDPQTLRMRDGVPVLPRQRMDFLLLFSSRDRVVIEVDGKQHYADGNLASPTRYAEMVAADRQLRLDGYEIYRFGGAELNSNESSKAIVRDFFEKLFSKHGIRAA